MPEKLLYGNARGAILALSTSRKDIDDDAVSAAVGVAEGKAEAGNIFWSWICGWGSRRAE
jgi:hypothetical protein